LLRGFSMPITPSLNLILATSILVTLILVTLILVTTILAYFDK